MATFIECMRYDGGGFVAIRASSIESVTPVFGEGDEFKYSIIALTSGARWQVNEVWEQIDAAIGVEGFAAATPTIEALFS